MLPVSAPIEMNRELKLTRAGRYFLLVIVLCLGLSFSLTHNLLFLLSSLFSALFLINAFSVFRAAADLRAELFEVEALYAERRGLIGVSLWPKRHHFYGWGRVGIVGQGFEPVDKPVSELNPREPASFHLAVVPERRGRLEVEEIRFTSSYPFGLTMVRISIKNHRLPFVYPSLLEEMPRRLESERKVTGVQSGDRGDFNYVTNYRAGDDVRLIHWRKSTLTQDPILLRERVNRDQFNAFCFLPDPCPHFEYAVSAMATFASEQSQMPGWTVLTNKGLLEVQSPDHFLEILAEIEPLNEIPDDAEVQELRAVRASDLLPS